MEVETAGARVWRHVDDGTGPPIVLVHGTMDRSSSFGRMARVLAGRRVLRYDRRGYGRSLSLGPPASFAQQVDDLLEVIGDEPALVFGHSYGGTIALGAATRAPTSMIGIAVYECPMPWFDWWPATSAGAAAVAEGQDPGDAAERFMIRVVGETRWQRLPPSTRGARRAEGPTMVAELGHLRPPNPPPFDLADVAVPVVAAHGTTGAEHHRRSIAEIAATIPGARLSVVDGAGHGVHLSHPSVAAELVVDALPR